MLSPQELVSSHMFLLPALSPPPPSSLKAKIIFFLQFRLTDSNGYGGRTATYHKGFPHKHEIETIYSNVDI